MTSMSPMLATASASPVPGTSSDGESLSGPVDLALVYPVMAIERSVGQSEKDAREAALALLGVRGKAAAGHERVEPPAMSPEAFGERLSVVVSALDALSRPSARVRSAAL